MRILDFADGFESNSQPDTITFAASDVVVTPVGNLSSTDLQSALVELQGDINTINASEGVAGGIATLDMSGKVPTSQLPALVIIDVNAVADIAARNALTVQEGDIAIVANAGGGVTKTYIYDGSSWLEIVADGSLAAHAAATTGTHGVAGNILGTSDAQVVTNKDIDGGTAANTRRITIPKDTKSNLDALTRKEGTIVYATDTQKFYKDDGSTLKEVGSGSGSGGINYITNFDIETDISGHVAYADAAAATPVDGTGGSPSITVTRSTSSPLRGTASALITKGAANRQGEGDGIAFTIDSADKNKQLKISFDYEASANYTGSSGSEYMVCYVYDVTNATLITTSNINMPQGSGTQEITFNSTSSTSYRLIFHIAGTGTSSWTYKYDNLSVGPQQLVLSTAISNVQDWVPVFSNVGTVSNVVAKWWQIADRIYVKGSANVGTIAADVPRISLPNNFLIDSSELTANPRNRLGTFSRSPFATEQYNLGSGDEGFIVNDGSTNSRVALVWRADNYFFFEDNGTTFLTSGELINFEFSFKASGISSNIALANSRVEYASNTNNNSSTDTTSFSNDSNGSPIPASTFAGAVLKRIRFKNPVQATDTLVLQIKPDNSINAWFDLDAMVTDAGSGQNTVAYDPVTNAGLCLYAPTTGTTTDFEIVVGRYQEQVGSNWSASNTSRWRVVKYSNAVPVEVTPSNAFVGCLYYWNTSSSFGVAAGSIPSATLTTIDYNVSVLDPDSAVTTGAAWHYTVPVGKGGKFQVAASIELNSALNASSWLEVDVNGTVAQYGQFQTANSFRFNSRTLVLNQGDTVAVRIFQRTGTNSVNDQGTTNNIQTNFISITRVAT